MQNEQYLIICRALVDLYSHPVAAENLAFRGGTALFKLHLLPARYSEDIDLVQMQAGPIGPIMDAVQEKINPLLVIPKRKQSEGRVMLIWPVNGGTVCPGISGTHSPVYSRYQAAGALSAKKGRDLFDLFQTAKTLPLIPETVVSCFLQYMEYEEHQISRAEFEMNLFEKLDDSRFLDDISSLLTTGSSWDSRAAARYVLDSLISLMPLDAWQKTKEKMIVQQKR